MPRNPNNPSPTIAKGLALTQEQRQERYERIVAAVASGQTYRQVAAAEKMTSTRVGQIIEAGPPGRPGWSGEEGLARRVAHLRDRIVHWTNQPESQRRDQLLAKYRGDLAAAESQLEEIRGAA